MLLKKQIDYRISPVLGFQSLEKTGESLASLFRLYQLPAWSSIDSKIVYVGNKT